MEVEKGAGATTTAPAAGTCVAAVAAITANAVYAVIPTDVDHTVNSNVPARQQRQRTRTGVFHTIDRHVRIDVDGIKRKHRERVGATIQVHRSQFECPRATATPTDANWRFSHH